MTNLKNVTAKTAKTKAMKLSEYLNNATSIISKHQQASILKRDALSIDQFNDSVLFTKAVKSENSRIAENELLKSALKQEDLAKIFFENKISVSDLMTETYACSREFKFRFLKIIKAIAQNDSNKFSKCDDRIFSAIASKRLKASDIAHTKMQNIMQHTTMTQSVYLSNCAKYLKFATVQKDSSDKNTTSFDVENAFFKKIMSLYA